MINLLLTATVALTPLQEAQGEAYMVAGACSYFTKHEDSERILFSIVRHEPIELRAYFMQMWIEGKKRVPFTREMCGVLIPEAEAKVKELSDAS